MRQKEIWLAVVESTLEQDIERASLTKHTAIKIENVWEQFRIFHDKRTSFKDFLISFKRSDYSNFWALKNVSLDIEEGDVFGIIGENGSGKSTLLKCISGILVPTQGDIKVRGKISPLIELGAGFQGDLTGRENIYLNSSILGLSRSEILEREKEIISFSEIEEFIDSPIKNYSSGMKVRLAFAVAINVDPNILLIDEVLAVGDESFRKKCFEKLNEFKRAHKTIVLVSHSLEQIRNLCNKAAWLEKGELREVGDVERVLDAYKASVQTKREALMKKNHQEASAKKKGRSSTGEVKITSVRFLDAQGEAMHIFETSAPITIEFEYFSQQNVTDLVFNFTFYTSDNVMVLNKQSAPIVGKMDERGLVRCVIPKLQLMSGTYLISVAARPKKISEPNYDYHQRMYKIDVVSKQKDGGRGIIYLEGAWEYTNIS